MTLGKIKCLLTDSTDEEWLEIVKSLFVMQPMTGPTGQIFKLKEVKHT